MHFVVLRDGITMAKTHVICDGIHQARMLLMHLHGEGNVFSIQALMDEEVTEGTKTLTAWIPRTQSPAFPAAFLHHHSLHVTCTCCAHRPNV